MYHYPMFAPCCCSAYQHHHSRCVVGGPAVQRLLHQPHRRSLGAALRRVPVHGGRQRLHARQHTCVTCLGARERCESPNRCLLMHRRVARSRCEYQAPRLPFAHPCTAALIVPAQQPQPPPQTPLLIILQSHLGGTAAAAVLRRPQLAVAAAWQPRVRVRVSTRTRTPAAAAACSCTSTGSRPSCTGHFMSAERRYAIRTARQPLGSRSGCRLLPCLLRRHVGLRRWQGSGGRRPEYDGGRHGGCQRRPQAARQLRRHVVAYVLERGGRVRVRAHAQTCRMCPWELCIGVSLRKARARRVLANRCSEQLPPWRMVQPGQSSSGMDPSGL